MKEIICLSAKRSRTDTFRDQLYLEAVLTEVLPKDNPFDTSQRSMSILVCSIEHIFLHPDTPPGPPKSAEELQIEEWIRAACTKALQRAGFL